MVIYSDYFFFLNSSGLSYADLENVKKYNDLEVKTINRATSPRRTTPLTASQTSPSLPHVEVQTTRKVRSKCFNHHHPFLWSTQR